ncbi:MAG: hypothetical protein KJ597_05490 [Nanoarchaeota archaeon]|nr:hypothetical protein [Nanoarchaeota archaeon]MBU1622998.1 hypothetical protein [Nanoarchaeota archaeon]
MAKKKVSKCCNWSAKDWLGVLISEGSLYLFLWYVLWMLEVSVVNQWMGALVSLVLINVMFFACPVFRKHFM